MFSNILKLESIVKGGNPESEETVYSDVENKINKFIEGEQNNG